MNHIGRLLSVGLVFLFALLSSQDGYGGKKKASFYTKKQNQLFYPYMKGAKGSGTVNYSFGGADVGSSKLSTTGLILEGTASFTVHTVNLSGTGFALEPGANGCRAGVFPLPAYACYLNVSFNPTSLGTYTGTFSITYTQTFSNGTVNHGSMVFYLIGQGLERVTDHPACTLKGSIINPTERTLAEEIPLVGTDMSLQYNSRLAEEYKSTKGELVSANGFNQEGWVLSVQKFYDSANERLFGGSGVSGNKSFTDLATNETFVVSSDGQEIYVFDDLFRHIKTLTFLTGALKYQFTYDSSNLLEQISDTYGNTTIITRNLNGYITSIVAPHGQITKFTLDGNGRFLTTTNPKNETFTFTYKTGTSLLATFKKPGGQITTLTYDANGHLMKDLGNWGNFWKLHKGSSGEIILKSNLNRQTVYATEFSTTGELTQTIQDPKLLKTTIYEDSAGGSVISNSLETMTTTNINDERLGSLYRRTSSKVHSSGGITSSTVFTQNYNPGSGTGMFDFASLTNTSTTSGRVSTVQFNNSTKQATTTSPEGIVSIIKFNAYEKPIETQLGSDVPVTYSYDINGRLAQSKQGSKNQIDYTYNSAGYLQTVTNARSEQTSYSYDLAGRIVQKIMPSLDVIQYQYDTNGNVISITPPYKATHWFSYNAAELPLTYGVAGSFYPRSFSHNLDKQMTTFNNAGKIATYGYDVQTGALNYIQTANGNYFYTYSGASGLGLVTAVQSPDGIQNNFSYDGVKLSGDEQVRISDSSVIGRVDFAYDTDYRIVGRFLSSIFGSNYNSVTLNDDDQPTQSGALFLTYNSVSGRLSTTSIDKISDSRTYDSYGNLASYTAVYQPTSGPAVTLYSYTITRDIMSRISSISETVGSTTIISDYTYNNRGWLTEVHRTGGGYDIFTYDFNGNRTSRDRSGSMTTAVFDSEDRMISYGSKIYTYDYNGDLKTSQLSIGATSTYNYDVFGNLVVMDPSTGINYGNIVDGLNRVVGQKASTIQKRFLYQDKLKIAAELDIASSLQKEFIYASGSQTPDYMIVGSNKYRIITNHLGSPRLVVNVNTGVVSQALDYDVLGRVISNTNPDFQPFGFAGGLYNKNTNLVRFGARDYDAEIGRWTTKDPILFEGGDTNLYGYVMNDPVNFIDPTGLTTGVPQTAIDDATIGGGGAAIGIGAGMCPKPGQASSDRKTCAKAFDAAMAGCARALTGAALSKCVKLANDNYIQCLENSK